jgi:hypothetical protein
MAKQATIIVLLLVFVGAIFIHYVLTAVEGFKNKKRRNLKSKSGKRKSGKRSGKKRSGKKRSGKKRSGKRPAKRPSASRPSASRLSAPRPSAPRPSAKRLSAPRPSAQRDSGMKFSDVVGSLLTPSLPDSRDLKDKLHAAVDQTPNICYGGRTNVNRCPMEPPQIVNTYDGCREEANNCSMPLPQVSNSCSKPDTKNLGCDSMPYIADMDDYIRKDSIPCYGCNLK